MQTILNYTELYAVVERSVSIIAKRSVDDQGNHLFDNITLGSRETEIINDYFRSAIVSLATDLRQYVTLEQATTSSYTIAITLYPDYNNKLENTIVQAIKDFMVAYALYSWFTISAPRIADKYLSDANAQKSYIIAQVFHRQRPSSHPNPLRNKTS